MLLVVSLAAALLAAWHESDAENRRRQLQAESGRLFAMWLRVAHRATMRTDFRAALAADPDGFALLPSALPGAPVGLPVPAGLTLGVMPDGSGPAPGVPMAWAVLAVAPDARAAARIGAYGAGLADVAVGGASSGAMAARAAGVGAARGASVPAGALFATADLAIPFEDEALYRRAQPGRPWANRMEAALSLEDGGGTRHDILRAGAVDGLRGHALAGVSTQASSTVAGGATGRNWSIGREPVAPCAVSATVPCLVTGALDVGTAAEPADLTASGAFRAGSARFADELRANAVLAPDGRVGAGSFSTVGAVDAALLVVGAALDGVTELRSATRMVVGDLHGTGGIRTGRANAVTVNAGSLDASAVAAGRIDASGDAFGPSAVIAGTLTVSSGGCDGC